MNYAISTRQRFAGGPTGEQLCMKYAELKSARTNWDHLFQELRDYVRPNAADFTKQSIGGEERTDKIFDGTAPWACTQFVGGLHSSLMSPTERWFNIVSPDPRLMRNRFVLAWSEQVSDILYSLFSHPRAAMSSASHEALMDLGGFGTGVLFMDWNMAENQLRFRSFPLADVYCDESYEGIVDTVYRRIRYTKRQAVQHFGEDNLCDEIKKAKDTAKFEFFHAVFPRTDFDPSKKNKKNKPFASFYVCTTSKRIMSEGGYDSLCYAVPRWNKEPGQAYGRSPGMDCLPDIRMLNKISEVTIKAAQLAIAPPMMLPDEAFMRPIRTTPFALNYFEPGSSNDDMIKRLPIDPQGAQLGIEFGQARAEAISKAYFVDYIRAQRKKERQTAYEIADDRQEQLRMMSPMLGRIISEFLGPIISRAYQLADDAGLIPDAPPELLASGVKVVYSSQAYQAQLAAKGVNMERFMQSLIPIGQIDPSVFESIDFTMYNEELSIATGVTRKILRSPEDVAKRQQAREQQQALLSGADAGAKIAGGVKDLAQAGALARQ